MQAVSCTWCIPSSFRKGVFHMHISCSNSNKTASIPMTLMQSLVPKCLATHLMPSWYKTLWCNHPSPTRPPSKYCQRVDDDRHRLCRFGYPHALQSTTSIDSEGRPHYRRRNAGDEMVVPHCLPLLRKFRCHLNFEIANTSHLFQYLFKYIHKGEPYIFHICVGAYAKLLCRSRSGTLSCPCR